ncbi:hypothetical protein [Lysinibacillus xylanilyticus]|uniref:hypothetical protein n=1 Tax=Lysinibacillus xylanilyticus TaxID=582475 RepID=UPI00381F0275
MLTPYEVFTKIPVFRNYLLDELKEEGVGEIEQLLIDKYPEDYKKLKTIFPLNKGFEHK